MTRTEARMVAQELYKLIKNDILRQVSETAINESGWNLNIDQASEILGWKPKTIRNKIKEIPHIKVGGRLRFSEYKLRKYLIIQN